MAQSFQAPKLALDRCSVRSVPLASRALFGGALLGIIYYVATDLTVMRWTQTPFIPCGLLVSPFCGYLGWLTAQLIHNKMVEQDCDRAAVAASRFRPCGLGMRQAQRGSSLENGRLFRATVRDCSRSGRSTTGAARGSNQWHDELQPILKYFPGLDGERRATPGAEMET